MKLTTALPFLVVTTFLLTACGESSTEELPEGTAPNDAPERAVEQGEDPQPMTNHPTLVPEADSDAEAKPEVAAPPPLPLPVAEDDAKRSQAPGISYVLPEGWTVGPKKTMRLLTLLPPNAGESDLAISRWPGDVGGFASNVTRWRRQVGLPPIQGLMTAAASDFEKFIVGDTTATWIPSMNEQTNLAILAVWVPRGENPENPTETWTFKLTCKADQVATLAPAFRAFCESVTFD